MLVRTRYANHHPPVLCWADELRDILVDHLPQLEDPDALDVVQGAHPDVAIITLHQWGIRGNKSGEGPQVRGPLSLARKVIETVSRNSERHGLTSEVVHGGDPLSVIIRR